MPSNHEIIRMPDAERQALADYAKQNSMSKSAVIRKALSQLIVAFPDNEITQGKRTDIVTQDD